MNEGMNYNAQIREHVLRMLIAYATRSHAPKAEIFTGNGNCKEV